MYMEMNKKHALILLVMGAYLFFLGNSMIFITDPVESNYVLTAKEMLQAHNYISPQIYGSYWYDKPIFFYWELIAAFKIFGINEFAARFFPALFGIVGLFMTYLFARKLYDEKTGLISALILGTSFEYWLIAKTVITDMALFVFFDAVLLFFYLGYTTAKKNYYYACYVFAGLAVLTKGPIGILLPGFIIVLFLLYKRDWRSIGQMKLLPGMLLFLIVAGSWYFMMYAMHGQDFLLTFFGVHNILRATVSEHPRFDVWYYYTVMFFIGFFPWIFTVPMLIHKYWKKKEWPVIDQTTAYLLIWAFVVAIFYQCMATKYTTYTFPYLLPIAILAARLLLNHPKITKGVLVFNLIFYTVLTFFVAIPYCREYSAKDAAQRIGAIAAPGQVVISYGDYKTSSVFYSDHMVYRLEKAANIEGLEPKKMSWNSKNVMPFMAEEDISPTEPVLAIVEAQKADEFEQTMPGNWQLVDDYGRLKVFSHVPTKQ